MSEKEALVSSFTQAANYIFKPDRPLTLQTGAFFLAREAEEQLCAILRSILYHYDLGADRAVVIPHGMEDRKFTVEIAPLGVQEKDSREFLQFESKINGFFRDIVQAGQGGLIHPGFAQGLLSSYLNYDPYHFHAAVTALRKSKFNTNTDINGHLLTAGHVLERLDTGIPANALH